MSNNAKPYRIKVLVGFVSFEDLFFYILTTSLRIAGPFFHVGPKHFGSISSNFFAKRKDT
jgi:hypothetical protein